MFKPRLEGGSKEVERVLHTSWMVVERRFFWNGVFLDRLFGRKWLDIVRRTELGRRLVDDVKTEVGRSLDGGRTGVAHKLNGC